MLIFIWKVFTLNLDNVIIFITNIVIKIKGDE